jgi:hypothetical protein
MKKTVTIRRIDPADTAPAGFVTANPGRTVTRCAGLSNVKPARIALTISNLQKRTRHLIESLNLAN